MTTCGSHWREVGYLLHKSTVPPHQKTPRAGDTAEVVRGCASKQALVSGSEQLLVPRPASIFCSEKAKSGTNFGCHRRALGAMGVHDRDLSDRDVSDRD
jgi:hypothetical protein